MWRTGRLGRNNAFHGDTWYGLRENSGVGRRRRQAVVHLYNRHIHPFVHEKATVTKVPENKSQWVYVTVNVLLMELESFYVIKAAYANWVPQNLSQNNVSVKTVKQLIQLKPQH